MMGKTDRKLDERDGRSSRRDVIGYFARWAGFAALGGLIARTALRPRDCAAAKKPLWACERCPTLGSCPLLDRVRK